MGKPTSSPLRAQKGNAGHRPAFRCSPCRCYRLDEIARFVLAALAFHEAGTWRGSVIAHAATIVANSTRLAHMITTSEQDR
jgi:hypothetical protein